MEPVLTRPSQLVVHDCVPSGMRVWARDLVLVLCVASWVRLVLALAEWLVWIVVCAAGLESSRLVFRVRWIARFGRWWVRRCG